MKKIHARQSTLKKIFMLWPKKIPAARKLPSPPSPPPPITFLMVRPLIIIWGEGKVKQFS